MKSRRLTPAQVRAAYVLYDRGWTMPRIAEHVWERFGFATQESARHAIGRAFQACGYQRRDAREAALLRYDRACSECGCDPDERTPGCEHCVGRHHRRKVAGLPYVPADFKTVCTGCGCKVDEQTEGCSRCLRRFRTRRYRANCLKRSPVGVAAPSPPLPTPLPSSGLPGWYPGDGTTPSCTDERKAA